MTPTPCPDQSYVYSGFVTRVIDADTLEIDVDLGFHLKTKQHFRLVNVNAPEMRGDQREAGLAAKQYAMDRLLLKEVVIRTAKADSFGRWLAHVWILNYKFEADDFNAELVNLGYAIPYRDGKGGA